MKIKNKYSIFSLACGSILLVQCLLIAFCNFTLGPDNIDCDIAKLYVHAIEMVKNRNYIIPDWSIITTLELDCSLLFAVPIFALCKNIYISFGIANMLLIAIMIATIFMLFSKKNELYPLLCCNFILIPYGIGQLDYFNMMFFNGSQYMMKILIALMLITILTRMEDGKSEKSDIVLVVLYSAFLFISMVSSGVYVAAVAIFPIFAAYICYHLYHRREVVKAFWGYGIWSGILCLAGLLGNRKLAAGAKGNSMTLCSVKELYENVTACFWGIFQLFHGVTKGNVEVMSLKGIRILVHMAFVILLLFFATAAIRKILKKEASIEVTLLAGVFVWNTFVLCICQTRYAAETFEYRYHLMGMIPVICILAISIAEWYGKETVKWQRGIALVMVSAILVLNASSYWSVFRSKWESESYQKICNWVVEEGYEYAYFLNDSVSAEICRLLDYENAKYLTVDSEGKTIVHDYYNKYVGQPMEENKSVLIVKDVYDDRLEFGGKEYVKVHTMDSVSFYQ